MNKKEVPFETFDDWVQIDPDEVQDRLVESVRARRDHGGHEHSRDWDDWLKADRALKSEGNKKKKVHSKPLEI